MNLPEGSGRSFRQELRGRNGLLSRWGRAGLGPEGQPVIWENFTRGEGAGGPELVCGKGAAELQGNFPENEHPRPPTD